MSDNQNCIRVFADVNQIRQDKNALVKIGESLTSMANQLNLAGNETRLKILYLLHRERQLCVCDLSDVLEMKTPAVSQHLRKLKDGGMIQAQKKGQTIFYHISEDSKHFLAPLFSQLQEDTTQNVVEE
jgi:DNA-binding transcriptional ArsR family regulator